MTKRTREALEIINLLEKKGKVVSANSFGIKFWTKDRNSRLYDYGEPNSKLNLCAGSFLHKLEKDGYIEQCDDGWKLSEHGRGYL